MGFLTLVIVVAIVLLAIGLGIGVFFSGLIRGADIVGEKIKDSTAIKDAQNFIQKEDRVDSSSVPTLILTTDSAIYDSGKPIKITAKNIGEMTLNFPDASLGLEVENVATGHKLSAMSAQVITELAPGQSRVITWNENAPSGDYTATVHTTPDQSVSAQVSFKIK